MKEALRQLKELQTERRDRHKAEMDEAIRLLKAREMQGLSFDPAGFGFVCTSAEIARRDRLHHSKLAEKAGFNLADYLRTQSSTAGDLVTGDVCPRIESLSPIDPTLHTPCFPLS
jgi:hypothetical protein